MAKPTVVFTEAIPPIAAAKLAAHANVEVWKGAHPMPHAALVSMVHHADALVPCVADRIDGVVFAAGAPSLKIVANYAVGYDNIDLTAAERHSVIVTNTPGGFAESVAEHAIALMLAVGRQIVQGDAFVRTDQYTAWDALRMLGPQFQGKTFGIVGLGRIGANVARIAGLGFGMRVLYSDLRRNEAVEKQLGITHHSLDVVLEKADVLSVHTPLMPSTHHLLGERQLARMKPTAILVNTSRGAVIDELALIRALKSSKIAGAGLDVFEHEPKVAAALRGLKNVVLTPHIASATFEARNAMAETVADNILAVLAGKPPLNPVH